jgi:thiamine monophosphate kinase
VVIVGAGDDCAVLEAGLPDRYLLFKTDAVVEVYTSRRRRVRNRSATRPGVA